MVSLYVMREFNPRAFSPQMTEAPTGPVFLSAYGEPDRKLGSVRQSDGLPGPAVFLCEGRGV